MKTIQTLAAIGIGLLISILILMFSFNALVEQRLGPDELPCGEQLCVK